VNIAITVVYRTSKMGKLSFIDIISVCHVNVGFS